MKEPVSKDLRQQMDFADKIVVSPYKEVQERLQKAADETTERLAKEAERLFCVPTR